MKIDTMDLVHSVDIGGKRMLCKHSKVLSLGICLVFIFSLSLSAFSMPVQADVIVVMGSDASVKKATQVLEDNLVQAEIVEYNSPEYLLTISRAVSTIIWVSHGDEEGISANGQKVIWSEFSSRIRTTPGKDIVLACESANVHQYVSGKEAFTFEGGIDAGIAAGLVAALVLSSRPSANHEAIESVCNTIIDEATDISLNHREVMPLGTVPAWWIAVKAVLVAFLTAAYFASAEAELPKAVAESTSPILIVAFIAFVFTLLSGVLFWALQQFFPSVASLLAVASPLVNVLAGLAIQKVIQGTLPGASYLVGLLLGRVAALFGATTSLAAPWIRAAFAASAAILAVSILDFIVVTCFTFLT